MQFIGNLGMDQLENISGHTVFKVGYLSVLLDLKAAGGYLLRCLRLTSEKSPCDHLILPSRVRATGQFHWRLMINTILSSMRSWSPICCRCSSCFTACSRIALQISLAD